MWDDEKSEDNLLSETRPYDNMFRFRRAKTTVFLRSYCFCIVSVAAKKMRLVEKGVDLRRSQRIERHIVRQKAPKSFNISGTTIPSYTIF